MKYQWNIGPAHSLIGKIFWRHCISFIIFGSFYMCGILMYRSRRNIGKIIHSQDLCRMKSSGNELTFQIYVNPELNKYISHYDFTKNKSMMLNNAIYKYSCIEEFKCWINPHQSFVITYIYMRQCNKIYYVPRMKIFWRNRKNFKIECIWKVHFKVWR